MHRSWCVEVILEPRVYEVDYAFASPSPGADSLTFASLGGTVHNRSIRR